MSAIRRLVASAEVRAIVIVLVKIVGDADLRVDQAGKNGPLAEFEHLRFEPGPAAFGLGRTRQGWVGATMPEELVTTALQRAFFAQPSTSSLLVHSDRGRTR